MVSPGLIAALLPALAMVESGNDTRVRPGDSGKSIGIYQIQKEYWAEGTRYLGVRWPYADAKDRHKAGRVVSAYLTHHGEVYERKTGRKATAETLAKIHNGGPYGWRKKATEPYWRKVKKELKRQHPTGCGD